MALPSIVEFIATNLREMVPVKTIRPYQRGIQYTFGLLGTWRDWQKQRGHHTFDWKARWFFRWVEPVEIDHKPRMPGWEWYFPFIQQVDIIDTNEETFDLLVQSITTKDDKAVSFSANIVWYVIDAIAYMTNVQNAEKSMEGASRVYCARRIRGWEYKDLVDKQKELESELKTLLNQKSKKWGVRVVEIGLTDFVQTKQFRLFGDNKYLGL